jgi:hypothetical protein
MPVARVVDARTRALVGHRHSWKLDGEGDGTGCPVEREAQGAGALIRVWARRRRRGRRGRHGGGRRGLGCGRERRGLRLMRLRDRAASARAPPRPPPVLRAPLVAVRCRPPLAVHLRRSSPPRWAATRSRAWARSPPRSWGRDDGDSALRVTSPTPTATASTVAGFATVPTVRAHRGVDAHSGGRAGNEQRPLLVLFGTNLASPEPRLDAQLLPGPQPVSGGRRDRGSGGNHRGARRTGMASVSLSEPAARAVCALGRGCQRADLDHLGAELTRGSRVPRAADSVGRAIELAVRRYSPKTRPGRSRSATYRRKPIPAPRSSCGRPRAKVPDARAQRERRYL